MRSKAKFLLKDDEKNLDLEQFSQFQRNRLLTHFLIDYFDGIAE